jgi:hypothetical protein
MHPIWVARSARGTVLVPGHPAPFTRGGAGMTQTPGSTGNPRAESSAREPRQGAMMHASVEAKESETRMPSNIPSLDDAADERIRAVVDRWLSDPLSPDPIQPELQVMRAAAAYLRERWGDETKARIIEQLATQLEGIVRIIGEATISYAQAGEVSVYSPGTIANKVSSSELVGGNGRVAIGSLPISASKAPHLHAVAAVKQITENRQAARTGARERSRGARAVTERVTRARDRLKVGTSQR